MTVSALISIFPGNDVVSECHACIGVDVHAAVSAPNGECIRINIDLFDDIPLSSELLEAVIGALKPFCNPADKYPIRHELKHCQAEVDAAANAGDIEVLKAILRREGIESVDRHPFPGLSHCWDKVGQALKDDNQAMLEQLFAENGLNWADWRDFLRK